MQPENCRMFTVTDQAGVIITKFMVITQASILNAGAGEWNGGPIAEYMSESVTRLFDGGGVQPIPSPNYILWHTGVWDTKAVDNAVASVVEDGYAVVIIEGNSVEPV